MYIYIYIYIHTYCKHASQCAKVGPDYYHMACAVDVFSQQGMSDFERLKKGRT